MLALQNEIECVQGRDCLTGLDTLQFDGDRADLLVGGSHIALGLLETGVQIGNVGFVNANTSSLILDLMAQAVDGRDVLITLKLSGVKGRTQAVGVTLQIVVLVGPLLDISDGIALPSVGPLKLVLETTLLVEELSTFVLEDADTLVGMRKLLGPGVEMASKVCVPALDIAELPRKVTEVAAKSLDVTESVVTLGVGIMNLSVLGLEFGETSVVMKLEARERRLQSGVVLASAVLVNLSDTLLQVDGKLSTASANNFR